MDKIVKFIKENKNKIFITLFVFLIFFGFGSNIFAAINKNSDELTSNPSVFNTVIKWLASLAGNVASGTILKLISTLLLAVAGILFLIIYLVWNAFGGIGFPSPDKIIFNEISLFDPNFFNYNANNGVMEAIKDAVSPIYFTFFIIAGALMIIAAMVIGIKLAITSIAVEKAQYKELLNKWLIGIVLLFGLHFLILGVFTINEKICEVASDIAGDLTFEAKNNWGATALTNVVNSVSSFFGGLFDASDAQEPSADDKKSAFTGYTGVIYYLIINTLAGFGISSGGGIIYVIILLALLGQTVNLIIHYVKRLIFLIFLVIFAPLVVAVDVIKKAV